MMALNRYRLKHMAKQGHRSARLVMQLLAHTDRLLGVILLGNTLVNASATALVTVITIRLYGDGELPLAIATILLTFTLLIFCEITPKVVAATHPERVALPSSYVLTPLLKLARPVVWFVNLFVQTLLWLIRVRPDKASSHTLTMEELRTLVLEESHFIPKKHRSILLNLFDLETITVDDVMTPRNQVEAIDLDAAGEVIREQLGTCYHTRLPAYRGEFNNVVGIVHVRKVLNLLQDEAFGAEALKQVLSEPYFIPAGTPLFSQLQLFQETRKRIGLVVDEYGELMGLVTLEDILEEIIGEFTTHSPVHSGGIAAQEDGSWLVEGGCLLRELNRKLGLKLPLDGPKTLNGLIVEHLQDIPEAGTSVKIAGHPMEIIQTQDRVIKVVKVFPPVKSLA